MALKSELGSASSRHLVALASTMPVSRAAFRRSSWRPTDFVVFAGMFGSDLFNSSLFNGLIDFIAVLKYAMLDGGKKEKKK